MLYLPFAGIMISFKALALAGLLAGVVSGFFGISGSLLITPLVNILGLPMAYTVGSNLTYFFGQSVLTSVKNNALRGVDWKSGLILGASGAGGAYLGKILLVSLEGIGAAGPVLRTIYAGLLVGVVFVMVIERMHSDSNYLAGCYDRLAAIMDKIRDVRVPPIVRMPDNWERSISLWPLLFFGVISGFLTGALGLSGSFIRLPFLVFMLGLPLMTALCTEVLIMLITTGACASFYAGSGYVEPLVAILLLLSVSTGSKLGFMANRFANRSSIKLPFLLGLGVIACGIIIQQSNHPAEALILIFTTPLALTLYIACSAVRGYCRSKKFCSIFPNEGKVNFKMN